MKQPELGKKLLELRQRKGLTQTELAEKCNLSLRTIQRIEAAETTPRSYTVKVLFAALDHDFRKRDPRASALRYVRELLNLKTNTMKKLSVLSLLALVGGLFFANTSLNAQAIDGWFLAGSASKSYKIGLDKAVWKTAPSSALLETTKKKIDGFGTLMQSSLANDYLGKRVRMTAWVKAEDVAGWAGMWLRIDGRDQSMLGFDNMEDRPIKGTRDWTKCEIVLDVPKSAGTLNFGVLLDGTGKVWFDDIKFEVVDQSVDITQMEATEYVNEKPTNLGFE